MGDEQLFNLTFSGCGFMGVYHIGVMSCLKENAAGFLQRVKCFGGASAGAFAAVGLVMDLDISEVAESVIKLSTRANSLSFGPLDPSFQIVKTVERAFDKMLPENAHEIASGKLHISLTRVPDLKNVIVSKFFSKEDLIEALVSSSFVPFYSGIFPAVFRRKYYVDGGISDNLPQHFKEGETITVSPFSGESDICPKDSSSNDVHIELNNTSMQFTLQNFYRFSCALFPPHEDVMSKICQQGYRDTLRFLQEHYPHFLTKESLRTAPVSLPQTHASTTTTHVCETCCSSLTSSVCSSCGNMMNRDIYSDSEMEEGESKLFKVLYELNNRTTESELWSRFVIRRSLDVVKVLSKPCAITVQQLFYMIKKFLESLTKMDKTGNKHIDNLLSVISMMMYTYKDKHQVQDCKTKKGEFEIMYDSAPPGKGKVNCHFNMWMGTEQTMKTTSVECQNRRRPLRFGTTDTSTAEPNSDADTYTNRECMRERNAQALMITSDLDDDRHKVLLGNDFMRCQLQECLQECLAGSFLCLESDNDNTEGNTKEEPSSTREGCDEESPRN